MPDDNPPQAILDLVHSMRDLEQRAAQRYRPVVDDIVRSGSRDAQRIEHTLDGLLGLLRARVRGADVPTAVPALLAV
jgi:hypothetical protein